MPSVAIGTTIPGPHGEIFKIIDFLGKGGFGEVYRATDETSGGVIAVKLLPLGDLSDEDAKLTLLNEVKAAQQIKHPNVVDVLFVNDGSSSPIGPFVAMEYVSGGTLARLLRVQEQSGAQIPLARAVEIMLNIAQGIGAINRKIIHRDIKPDNILIEGTTFKIGDFGISKFVDESTRLETFKGGQHVAYMAPEGWQHLPNTFKLDVYSAGLVFYQILTFEHHLLSKVKNPDSFLDWEKAHLYEHCPDVRNLRGDIPIALAQLLSRMVNKRSSERPQWDEIINILSKPDVGDSQHPSVAAAVDAAVARQKAEELTQLKLAQTQDAQERQLRLYGHACEMVLTQVEPLVNQFNESFQHGKITRQDGPGFTTYKIPGGTDIQISFFEPARKPIKINLGEVIGGGWIGLSQGRSANLVLVKQDATDIYGRWFVCEVGIMALADPSKLFGKYGIKEGMALPFGFKDAYFYDQIRYATGTVHAFTYSFVDDVADYFAFLIGEACR